MGYNTTKEQKAFQHHVQKALEFLLQEYDALKEFKEDLEQLKTLLHAARGADEKSFRKLFREFRYAARTERRFNRFLLLTEEDIQNLVLQVKDRKTREELEDLEKHLLVGGRFILAAASMHEGRIRRELDMLQGIYEVAPLDNAKGVEQMVDRVLQITEETLEWIEILPRDLQKARELMDTVLEHAELLGTLVPQMRLTSELYKSNPLYDEKISKDFDVPISVIDYSSLPTGTHKFLKATYKLKRASANAVGAITAGNYGLALKAVHQAHYPYKELHLFLDRGTDSRILKGLQGHNIIVHKVDLNAGWFGGKEMNAAAGKPVEDITHLKLEEVEQAYKFLRFSTPPSRYSRRFLFCPVGSGEFLAAHQISTWGSSDEYGLHVIGVVPRGHPYTREGSAFHPMPSSLADSLVTPWIAPKIKDKLFLKGFEVLEISEDDVRAAHALAARYGYSGEMSATVGFAALLPRYRERFEFKTVEYVPPTRRGWKQTIPDSICIIATGNGHKYFGIE